MSTDALVLLVYDSCRLIYCCCYGHGCDHLILVFNKVNDIRMIWVNRYLVFVKHGTSRHKEA